MAIAIYSKTCAKNVAGNYQKVFFIAASNISTVTGTTELSAITVASKFQEYAAEIDSVQFKIEGNGGQNYFTTQTLTMRFAKKTKALVTAIDELAALIPCGVATIHTDLNGVCWLTGFDSQTTVDPRSRPFNKMKVTFDSGMKPSDAEGNAITVELTRESEYENVPIDTTLSTAIIAKTAGGTTLIDYNA